MAPQNSFRPNGDSLEDGIRTAARRAQESFSEQVHRCEDAVRESPTNSIVIAGLVGYFLHVFPIGALLSSLVRLVAALVRPAVFLYVAAKFIDLLRTSAPARNDHPSESVAS